MFYCILLLAIFSIILVVRGYRTRYCWVFLIMLTGMIISFFSVFIYLTLFSDYTLRDGAFFNPDYLFFCFVRDSVKLPLSLLARMMNAGLGLYLLAIPIFVFEFTDNRRRITAKIVILVIFIVYYLLYYDPETAWRIYLRYHLGAAPLKYFYIIDLIHQFNQIGLILYLFYPAWLLYVYLQELRIGFIKSQITLLSIGLIVMTLFFYGVVFFSPFVLSVDNVVNYGFWIYYNISNIKTYYMVLPLATALVLSLVFILFFNFRLGSTVHIFTDRVVDRAIARMNEVLSDSLHSQKNLFFTIDILAREALGMVPETTEQLRTKIRKIETLSSASLERISEQLDSLRDVRIRVKNRNILEILERTVEKLNLPGNIQILKNYRARDRSGLVCRLDQYHMTGVFSNILDNAIESIAAASRDEGLIVITVTTRFQWIIVSIEDNGIGLRKKSLKKVFLPWYSEKTGPYNRGLGLSYVYKIVKAHYGITKLESRYGEGTSMYVMLPRAEGG
jgi:signal transduction histidine kinase